MLLAQPLAWGVQSVLRRDGFTGVTIAVVGEDGSAEAEAVLDFIGSREDMAKYCSLRTMGYEEAMEALRQGEVTAVLVVPPDFVGSVLRGENRSPTIHLDTGRPMESLLILHGVQNAADLLAAAQRGIYAVIDVLQARGLLTDRDIRDINFQYIRFTLTRSAMYSEEVVSAVGSVSVAAHYTQSLLLALLLCAGVIFYPVLRSAQGEWTRRCAPRAAPGAVGGGGAAAGAALLRRACPGHLRRES
jgi:hypothetical protein